MIRLGRSTAPARLLVLFLLLSVLPLTALGWLGWRVMQQDRALELQRSRERLEIAAEEIVRNVDRGLAGWDAIASQTAERMPVALPDGLAVLLFGLDGLVEQRGIPLPFIPSYPVPARFSPDIFAEAEHAEFRSNDLARAATVYGRLAQSSQAAIRAAALVRLARVLRKQRRLSEALLVYERLSEADGVDVAGSPAALVAMRERSVILQATGDQKGAARESTRLAAALAGGRFPIDRPTFEFFRAAAGDGAHVSVGLAFANALDVLWPDMQARRDGRIAWRGSPDVTAVWRKGALGLAVVLGTTEQLTAAARDYAARSQIQLQLAEPAAPSMQRGAGESHSTLTKSYRETGLPWTLQVMLADSEAVRSRLKSRRDLFAASAMLMALVIAASSYFVLRALNKELRVARLQSDFVAAVSHEFRTPLTAMCHLTEMLEEGHTPGERLAAYYRALGKESRRLHAMVESLLDFGRIDAGRRPFEFTDTDIFEFVSDTVRAFREERREAGDRISVESHIKRPGLRVRADRAALALALRSLLDNALKYSPPASPVGVSVRSEGRFVSISVDDEGAGVLKDERRHIFAKFARGSAAKSMNVKGTGIGLAMAAEIVSAHGGRLELESEPGRGSRFTTLLPVQPSHT